VAAGSDAAWGRLVVLDQAHRPGLRPPSHPRLV